MVQPGENVEVVGEPAEQGLGTLGVVTSGGQALAPAPLHDRHHGLGLPA